jgi:glycosidase
MSDEKQAVRTLRDYFPFGFPLSRRSWERYGVKELTAERGPGREAPEVYTLRLFAHRVNAVRLAAAGPAVTLEAGQLFTAEVIVEALRWVAVQYCHGDNPEALPRGREWTEIHRGRPVVEAPPPAFVGLFPPRDVARGEAEEENYLGGKSLVATGASVPNRDVALAEMIILAVLMENPAFRPLRELFDDLELKQRVPYLPLIGGLEQFFDREPAFGPLGMTLFRCLRAPMLADPDSLSGQLEYIRRQWGRLLPGALLERMETALDVLKEEVLFRGHGPGPMPVLTFGQGQGQLYGEPEGRPEPARFSADADWMSSVVILAKTTYVWLDQLSKQYQRPVRRLDEVPDEELDRLGRWGFTGLWLIGLWERSPASEKIKKIMGNPEAAASAYSLYDYTIAADLGGDEAYRSLRERAARRGIKLASDMVPNHTGIYSRWMVEHPDWFIQSPEPPYPWYQFRGEDLSFDGRMVLQIEDGYWEKRDAAVVLRRYDRATGEVRYIYHGNDGTNMPWNDTAQLNFMSAQVREAVIGTVLHVARMFPIIRFDAAMTLAKRHYQRLWFPAPGEGGAIPSRSEHGMSKDDFDRAMPQEFWREVVDRVAAEAPDTLLLAEAFWLMEGYFVRTLGMHRVYNSAFMNMLKMEDNGKYRTTIKNVLEFSPEVLKRFVNFMNNPDEDTAVAQFGKGDKYIGVCTLMVTMPGLPMFGHGQIEGLTEKYGMEYRRAYWDEQADPDLVRRHEAEIFPLLRRRRLFAGAEHFALFDFQTPSGFVDENVFAYTNRADGERALVLYNNSFSTARGVIHTSAPVNLGDSEAPVLARRTLSEALALNAEADVYYVFRDQRSGLEYVRAGRELAEQGFHLELHAYECRVFLDFREVRDADGSWSRLHRKLAGAGVEDAQEARRAVELEAVLEPFHLVLHAEALHQLAAGSREAPPRIERSAIAFYAAAARECGSREELEPIYAELGGEVRRIAHPEGSVRDDEAASLKHVLLAARVVHLLGRVRAEDDRRGEAELIEARLTDWLLLPAMRDAFAEFAGRRDFGAAEAVLAAVLAVHGGLLAQAEQELGSGLRKIFADPRAGSYLQLHEYEGKRYLNKERLERLLAGLVFMAEVIGEDAGPAAAASRALLLEAAAGANYEIEGILSALPEADDEEDEAEPAPAGADPGADARADDEEDEQEQ